MKTISSQMACTVMLHVSSLWHAMNLTQAHDDVHRHFHTSWLQHLLSHAPPPHITHTAARPEAAPLARSAPLTRMRRESVRPRGTSSTRAGGRVGTLSASIWTGLGRPDRRWRAPLPAAAAATAAVGLPAACPPAVRCVPTPSRYLEREGGVRKHRSEAGRDTVGRRRWGAQQRHSRRL